jgi:hypothetical protein
MQALPQLPQLSLSEIVLAQYGAPPSGAHVVNEPHVSAQVPPLQTRPALQALPQLPQLSLSEIVLAQYGAPPSRAHVVNEPQVVAHSPAAHT